MKQSIAQRTIACAQYIVDHNATLRQAAFIFGIGKSTVHADISKRLPKLNLGLYNQVHEVLKHNHDERHIRGGESTRIKYLAKKSDPLAKGMGR